MALALFTFLLALCSADAHPDYEPPYGEKLNPKPFQYEYGLESASPGAVFSKKEAQDDGGNVIGEVVVSLPDGRIQTTKYHADFYKGYNADVQYVGTPQYPPEQYQNYNSPKFIPVHLKSRPSAIEQNKERNRFKAQTLQSNSEFPYRKKQTLQPQLKSIESLDMDIEVSTKSQEIKVESEKINSLNDPGQTRTRQEKFASDSASLAQKMAKLREALKNIKKVKESPLNIHTQIRPLSTSKPENMLEMMKRIREDLKENNAAITSKMPSLIPKTPPLMVLKSHVVSEPIDKMIEIMKQNGTDIQKSEKLTISPVTPRKKSFQNRPLSPRRPVETVVVMNKFRENLKDKSEVKVLRLPSVNPETPPLMIIKSHIMSRPNHEQAELMKEELTNVPKVTNKNMKSPMSIKSHVISAPKPAESIKEIMKKIREDIEDKEHPNKVKLPTLVMKMKPHVKQAPVIMQVMSHVIENSELSTVKPLRDSVVDFMKKVELMKENRNKPNDLIMSVKSRAIQQSKQDGARNLSMQIITHVNPESLRLETVPSNEEPKNDKSMFEDKSPFTMFPDQDNKTMNKKENLAMDLLSKKQESPHIKLTTFIDQEMKRKEIEVQPFRQISLPQKEDNNDHQVPPIIIEGIESLAKPQPMIKYQEEQTEYQGNMKYANAGDWIEIRDRKPVMHILLNVVKKMTREKFNHKKDFLSSIFG